MSHTYRNTNTVPKGWTVRDNGKLYWHGDDHGGWKAKVPYPKFRRNVHACESKPARKQHQRQIRAKCKNLMRQGRYDEVFFPRRTSGWLTW